MFPLCDTGPGREWRAAKDLPRRTIAPDRKYGKPASIGGFAAVRKDEGAGRGRGPTALGSRAKVGAGKGAGAALAEAVDHCDDVRLRPVRRTDRASTRLVFCLRQPNCAIFVRHSIASPSDRLGVEQPSAGVRTPRRREVDTRTTVHSTLTHRTPGRIAPRRTPRCLSRGRARWGAGARRGRRERSLRGRRARSARFVHLTRGGCPSGTSASECSEFRPARPRRRAPRAPAAGGRPLRAPAPHRARPRAPGLPRVRRARDTRNDRGPAPRGTGPRNAVARGGCVRGSRRTRRPRCRWWPRPRPAAPRTALRPRRRPARPAPGPRPAP